ncbi:cilia- and flagella-associated protein 61-like [Corticium candelabrum]|uniref:cilia- and flagella-associated protein 61-like n=1 Tax=Corticium candelabrum TaxID=121492 RepID=UPI002E252F58|nr:cilia- and flagella-associated protein 61-like [Corticium candelabrum]
MTDWRSRRQVQYPVDNLGQNVPSNRILQVQEPYALYHINKKLTLEPKITVNARIVVVGASDVGLSFLETLSFSPHLHFNNLTLISPQGLPWHSAPDDILDNMLPQGYYSRTTHEHMSTMTWVNVVKGKMTAIDRENKVVTVMPGVQVAYDLLVLCCGKQFQMPLPQHGMTPNHVYVLNNEKDCKIAIQAAKSKNEGSIIVYGASIAAYTSIHALLSLGIESHHVKLVQPPSTYISCFNDPSVDQKVKKALQELDVIVYENCKLVEWNDGHLVEGGDLQSVTFLQGENSVCLECSIFICFDHMGVDYEAFKAINDCCLVFDGHLVVDADFCTSDCAIRAAGSLTKFSRRYHADQWSLGHFNSREVGQKLAFSVLRDYDPIAEQKKTQADDKSPPVLPLFECSKVVTATLPGGLSYLHVMPPALDTPFDVAKQHHHYGRDFVTDVLDAGYFRIQVDAFSRVRQLTCLTKQHLDINNLVTLYNLNEKYLNSLVSRFDEGLISNFYSYFQEPWAVAIFHDRFSEFGMDLNQLVSSRSIPSVPSLKERVCGMLKNDLELPHSERTLLQSDYENSQMKKLAHQRLLSYLHYNRYHLPMYARPNMV